MTKTAAVVPNATVEAVNVDTNVKYTTQANGQGEYGFTNLPVGTYNVSASAPTLPRRGCKTLESI